MTAGALGTCRARPQVASVSDSATRAPEVGDVGVGVQPVRVAEHLGGLAADQRAEEPAADHGARAHAGPVEVGRPPGHHPQPAGLVGRGQVLPQPGPDGALAGGRGQRPVLGQQAVAGPVAVQVLGHDQQRAGRRRRVDHAGLRGRLAQATGGRRAGALDTTCAPATAAAACAGSLMSATADWAPGTAVPERVTTAGVTPRASRAATTDRPTGPAPSTTCVAGN